MHDFKIGTVYNYVFFQTFLLFFFSENVLFNSENEFNIKSGETRILATLSQIALNRAKHGFREFTFHNIYLCLANKT